MVICSDGLDRGDPAVLAAAMERLSRLCHRIVWLNPHKGDDADFRPSTLGMMVAAPHVDLLLSGHDLRSLEELADAASPSCGSDGIVRCGGASSVEAEGDRVLTREEIVELADAVAASSGIASGIGTTSYGAQLVVEAATATRRSSWRSAEFGRAAARAGLPPWPVARVEAISEDDDLDEAP